MKLLSNHNCNRNAKIIDALIQIQKEREKPFAWEWLNKQGDLTVPNNRLETWQPLEWSYGLHFIAVVCPGTFFVKPDLCKSNKLCDMPYINIGHLHKSIAWEEHSADHGLIVFNMIKYILHQNSRRHYDYLVTELRVIDLLYMMLQLYFLNYWCIESNPDITWEDILLAVAA